MAGASSSLRYKELRRLWIEVDGAAWFSQRIEPPPVDWNAEDQLKNAGFEFRLHGTQTPIAGHREECL